MGIQINGNTNNINAGIGSLSIEDINELDIVGVATAANFKTGVSNLHSVGLTLSGGQLDVGSNIKLGNAGVITATSLDISGDIDVDGHTELDNVNIAGVTTFANTARFSGGDVIFSGTNNFLQWDKSEDYLRFMDGVDATFGNSDDLKIFHNGSNNFIETNNGDIRIKTSDSSGNLTFTAGGSNERLRILSNGRVHIRPSNTFYAMNTQGTNLVIGDGGGGVGLTFLTAGAADNQTISFQCNETLSRAEGEISYGPTATSVTNDRNAMMFRTNSAERLRIKSDGSVAIAGDNVTISTDTSHTVSRNEKVAIKNRYVDCGSTEINLDTSGNLGQSLNLQSHSSATNHYAVLTFDSGSLKSAIAGGRPNAGNWGTELRFYTHPSATSNVHKTNERMRIRQDGEINLTYGRVNDAGHQIYRYGGFVAGTATVSVDIPVLNHGNIYWIEAFYTHHSLSYGGYLYGVYGAYSGHNGLQINNTIGSSTAGGTNVGTWSVTRGNSGQPIVVAKSAGSYSGQGHWWVHVHAGNTPNI